jgi:hypothetical protein
MNFVDLFCGMGGASCGAVAAGMRVALAVDACPRALETHRQNHPDATHICATLPVKHLPLPPAPRHIHASPPCQKLSRANLNADDSEKERSVALVQWAVRFARRHGTTWSLEQVDSARVRACLDEDLLPPSKLEPSKKGSEVPGKTSSCLCHKARAGAINTLAYTHTRCARRTRDPSTLRVERLTPRQAAARVRASQRCAHPSRACPSRAHPTSVPHHHCMSVGEGRVRPCARGCRTRAPSLVRRVL